MKLVGGTGARLYRNDVPLYYLQDYLLGGQCNRFVGVPGLLKAINLWLTFWLLLPTEYLIFKDHDDNNFHCAVWDWWHT